jgi:hypothetical protein
MLFTRRLHAGIRSGEITCTVRIWQRCHVRVGGRYAVAGGHVEVDSIEQIDLTEVTGDLARRSGFNGVIDLLKVARHGRGEKVYLITFHYSDADAAARSDTRSGPPAQRRSAKTRSNRRSSTQAPRARGSPRR